MTTTNVDELGQNGQESMSVSSTFAKTKTPRARPGRPIDAIAISRKVKHATCKNCGRPILTGLDHDYGAHFATVDPTPLTRASELEALIAGHRTYGLWITRDGHELEHRDQFGISGPWITFGRDAILTDHACDRYWPQPPTAPTAHKIDREECPF